MIKNHGLVEILENWRMASCDDDASWSIQQRDGKIHVYLNAPSLSVTIFYSREDVATGEAAGNLASVVSALPPNSMDRNDSNSI